MKIEVNREVFIKTLNTSCSITGGKTALPILYENLFRFNNKRLEVVSSDLENIIVTGLNYELVDGEEESFVVDGSTILKTIQLLSIETIYLDVEVDANGFGTVTFGDPKRKKKYQIPISHAAESFPRIPDTNTTATIKLKAEPFKKGLKLCTPLCNPSDLRPGFQGVGIYTKDSRLIVSSTNGHSIVQVGFEVEGELPPMIVSKTTSNIIDNFSNDAVVEISVEDVTKKIVFTDGSIHVYSTLIDGKFPPIDNVIDSIDTTSNVVFNRVEVLQAIKRCVIMSSRETHALKFDFSQEGLILSAEDIDWSKKSTEEAQVISKIGEVNYELKLNGILTSQFLSGMETEEVTMYTKAPSTPVLFTPNNFDSFSCKFVLMPLRIAQ